MKILINLLVLILLPIILISTIVDGFDMYKISVIGVLTLYVLFVENRYNRITLSIKTLFDRFRM